MSVRVGIKIYSDIVMAVGVGGRGGLELQFVRLDVGGEGWRG